MHHKRKFAVGAGVFIFCRMRVVRTDECHNGHFGIKLLMLDVMLHQNRHLCKLIQLCDGEQIKRDQKERQQFFHLSKVKIVLLRTDFLMIIFC